MNNIYEPLYSSDSASGSTVNCNDPFDDFDLDDTAIDEFMGVIREVKLEKGDFNDAEDFIESDVENILDILGIGMREEREKPAMVRKHFDAYAFTLKKRVYRKIDRLNLQSSEDLVISSTGSDIFVSDGNFSHRVGVTKQAIVPFTIERIDYLELSSLYGEETSAKSTCLGYSSLVHCAAALAIAGKIGIMEPIEGHDVMRDNIFYEITGKNFDTRQTSASVVINKYLLLDAVSIRSSDYEGLISLAIKEDSYDCSGFVGSAIDQPDSPYTSRLNRLHELTRDINPVCMKFFYYQYRSYMSRKPPDVIRTVCTPPDSIKLNEAIIRGSKFSAITNENYLPSPFFVISGEPYSPEIGKSFLVLPRLESGICRTTYHNQPLNVDYVPMLLERPQFTIQPSLDTNTPMYQWFYGKLLECAVFSSIHIEAELLSKINGQTGCFYSVHSGAGIGWKALRSNSLTYYICYYRKSRPPASCGVWELINVEHDLYRSPSSKISVNDIEFAKCLPGRIYTMASSIFAYCTKAQRSAVINRLMLVAATYRHSTWLTSAIAGDMRFITLCTIAESGNIKSMIDKAADKIIKNASFPDIFLLKLMATFADNFTTRDKRTTPLFGLPMRMLSIDKDLPQGMMWHIRGDAHATNCFRKLVKGVHLEVELRPAKLAALDLQIAYLERAFETGVVQDDFDALIDAMPTCAYYNHILFMAMASTSTAITDAGKRQDATSVCINNLISDHHSVLSSDSSKTNGAILTTPRVADGVAKALKQYNDPPGILTLLLRMAVGMFIASIFLIHPKDSKSKEREIPQMTNLMRIIQFVTEGFLTIYCESEWSEKMQDHNKYPDFVNEYSSILRNNGMTRSEDKEFFCGHLHPECMSLCYMVVALVTGSTSIVTSAALQRCNKSRYTILPKKCDESIIDGIRDRISVFIKEGKTFRKALGILNYVHMQQGVYAIGGALVTTVFATGLDMLMCELLPDIDKTCVMTTSDDSVRGATISDDHVFNPNDTLCDYINTPPKLTSHCMMVDSVEKAIVSSTGAEFNNVAIGPNGMYPQAFIHSNLCIQPLLGRSVIEDLITVISNSKMTITWGDTIDLARAAFESGMVLMQQKWLLTQIEYDILIDHGLIPTCDEELLIGFSIRNTRTILKFLRMTPREDWNDLIDGSLQLVDCLRKYSVSDPNNRKKTIKVDYVGPVLRVNSTFAQINRSRRYKNGVKVTHLKQIRFDKRIAAKNRMIEALMSVEPDITHEEQSLVDQLNITLIARIIPSVPRMRTFLPCSIGTKSKIRKDYNIKGIMSIRRFSIKSSQILTPEEYDIARKGPEEFDKWVAVEKQSVRYEGYSFNSAGGRPLMRMHNGNYFTEPVSFNFEIDVALPIVEESNLTINGVYFENVQSCFYGSFTLSLAAKEHCNLAFAYAHVGDLTYLFLMKNPGRPFTYKVRRENRNYLIVTAAGVRWLCPLKRDLTPIIDGSYNMKIEPVFNPLMTGDTTAILNYGNYINTNATGAIKRMHKIFNTFNSNFPHYMSRIKPHYPYHPDKTVTIPLASNNVLCGMRSSTLLRFIPVENPKQYHKIDLTTSTPIVYTGIQDVIEEDWD